MDAAFLDGKGVLILPAFALGVGFLRNFLLFERIGYGAWVSGGHMQVGVVFVWLVWSVLSIYLSIYQNQASPSIATTSPIIRIISSHLQSDPFHFQETTNHSSPFPIFQLSIGA